MTSSVLLITIPNVELRLGIIKVTQLFEFDANT